MKGTAPTTEARTSAQTAGNVRLWAVHRRKVAPIQNAVPRHSLTKPLKGRPFIFRKTARSMANPGSHRRPARNSIVTKCRRTFLMLV
jgi:hypothetical protein